MQKLKNTKLKMICKSNENIAPDKNSVGKTCLYGHFK